ncbi:MAG: phospho-N-acetylmuramoyl-pentapeptide-transferase [Spirochaetales bacterium]|nr:phospho-N-acetylmuramoyl-pentapeptide-transferase [Spirochaetales bacterium]
MLRELLYPLVGYFTAFNVFQYITFRAAYAAITALFISFLIGPGLIAYLRRKKAGQEIRVDGPQTHLAKSGTPTMGGVLIIASVIVSVLLWQDISNFYTWLLIGSLLAFGLLGFVDDYLKVFKKNTQGLKAIYKFTGQLVISLVIVLMIYSTRGEYTTLLYLPFLKNPVLDLSWAYIPVAVIYLTGTANMVNLTDGLDGLAIGLVIFVALAFSLLAYLTGRADYAAYLQIPYLVGSGELTVPCFALVGASVGFLWFNAHPAEVFMGDTGSIALGGFMGVISLLLKKEVLMVIIGGVFVLEMLSVVIQVTSYKLTSRRVFRMAPLHHHFELKGWDETKVVIRFWILGGLFAILSLSTLKLQ